MGCGRFSLRMEITAIKAQQSVEIRVESALTACLP